MPKFYIQRRLYRGDKLVTDSDLIGQSGFFVVLAEPGAGKSDLLDFLSRSYGVSRELGSQFVYRVPTIQPVLVIDALDEVARIGEEKINEIIVKARASAASTIIFASRSYVWDQARTAAVRDCFGTEPTILRLEPFGDDEQRQLFASYLPSEDFEKFRTEAARFELTPILGNPQFLKLFADAYVEGDRRFTSKKQIYADAVRRLASERKTAAGATARPGIDKIVAAASEIFAKLLLSGASGVSANEEIEGDAYPYIRGISSDDRIADFALNTRLFKPTDLVNRHDPVHRIVAEYCAADYLIKRIEAPTNTFSLRRCLAIIAPNSTVRNELRGLLGWIASLGGRNTQQTIVKLDPYTVFANGDASQLHPSVKRQLLEGLETLAQDDPFFRRMDSSRTFNVAGFFSADVVQHVRPLLSPTHSKSHLRGLMLELLYGTEAGRSLEPEFRLILQDPLAEKSERGQAYRNIIAISKSCSHNDFDALVKEASHDSLDLASRMLIDEGISHFGESRTLAFVRALAMLYPNDGIRAHRLGSRYFVRQVVNTFGLDDTRLLLNGVTSELKCTCGQAKQYRCSCRKGPSKIAGYLVDRYFELMVGPHDPRQIRRWTEQLLFRNHINGDRSKSVDTMTQDAGLRRAIQISKLGSLSDPEEISNAMMNFFMSSTHSGLSFREGDYDALVDHAVATGNHSLWKHLIATHSPYDSRKGPYPLRARMRAQARASRDLLRIWTKVDRDHREGVRRNYIKFGRSRKRLDRDEATRKANLLANFQENRALIEAGRHWGWLRAFAQRYLHGAEEDNLALDDEQIIETALLNCFNFLAPWVPSLETIAERGGGAISMVLEAACLATFRRAGALRDVPLDVLRAVKAESIGGSAYLEGETEKFESHIDGLLFSSDADKIEFATRLIEAQLSRTSDAATAVPLLNHGQTFSSVKGNLAFIWLARYPAMPWHSLETLFGIAAAHGDRAQLDALIEARCSDPIDPSDNGVKRRKFWLLRHFFFVLPTSDSRWTEFSADPTAIFQIEHYAGRFTRHDMEGWPQLNAEQVYRVLDAFVAAWPRVPLPSSYGTGDPKEETAYRFLSDTIFSIGKDDSSNSIPVFDQILSDNRFDDFHTAIKSERAEALRKRALSGFQAPRSSDISKLLNDSKIASVEDMRALLIELLDDLQHRLKGASTNPVDVFYTGKRRVNENTARNRIVDMLEGQLRAVNLNVVVEHQMIDATRCDFTASAVIGGYPVVLVTELKGQWNRELYTAASAQLAGRYTIYPGAADQGVYLVLWFGGDVTIAGKKDPSITSPDQLRREIVGRMPTELAGRIDVYVLDVSRTKKVKRQASKKSRSKVAKKSRSKPSEKQQKKAGARPTVPAKSATAKTAKKSTAVNRVKSSKASKKRPP